MGALAFCQMVASVGSALIMIGVAAGQQHAGDNAPRHMPKMCQWLPRAEMVVCDPHAFDKEWKTAPVVLDPHCHKGADGSVTCFFGDPPSAGGHEDAPAPTPPAPPAAPKKDQYI